MTIGRRLSAFELQRSIGSTLEYIESSLADDLHKFSATLELYRGDAELGHIAARLSTALRDAYLSIRNASDAITPGLRATIAERDRAAGRWAPTDL